MFLYESSNTSVNTSGIIPVHTSVNTSVNTPANAPVGPSGPLGGGALGTHGAIGMIPKLFQMGAFPIQYNQMVGKTVGLAERRLEETKPYDSAPEGPRGLSGPLGFLRSFARMISDRPR